MDGHKEREVVSEERVQEAFGDSKGVFVRRRCRSEEEVVRRSLASKVVAEEEIGRVVCTAKVVSKGIEVKEAIGGQVSLWEKTQREVGQEERVVIIIIILVGFVVVAESSQGSRGLQDAGDEGGSG